MDGLLQVAWQVGVFIAVVVIALRATLRGEDPAASQEEREKMNARITELEFKLDSEQKTNAILHTMVENYKKDVDRIQKQWAEAWNQLQTRTEELLTTRNKLGEANTKNTLLERELNDLKAKVADHEKRLEALKQEREQLAAIALENERMALLNRGYFEGVPKFLKEMGLDLQQMGLDTILQEAVKNLNTSSNGDRVKHTDPTDHLPAHAEDESPLETKEVKGG